MARCKTCGDGAIIKRQDCSDCLSRTWPCAECGKEMDEFSLLAGFANCANCVKLGHGRWSRIKAGASC